MNFKFSHNMAEVTTTNTKSSGASESKQALLLKPSLLTQTMAFAPLVIGLLFILKGGITGILGLLLILSGAALVALMREVTVGTEMVEFKPAFEKLSFPGGFKTLHRKDITLQSDDVKGDFSFSPAAFRFFPLNATRVSAVSTDGVTVLAYLSKEDAAKVVDFNG